MALKAPITGREVATRSNFEESYICQLAFNNPDVCQDEYRWEFYRREMGLGNPLMPPTQPAGSSLMGTTGFGQNTLGQNTFNSTGFGQFTFGQPSASQPPSQSNQFTFGQQSQPSSLFTQPTVTPSATTAGGIFGPPSQSGFLLAGGSQPFQSSILQQPAGFANPQTIMLDKGNVLGPLVDSVDFNSLGAGSNQFWTNAKTEMLVKEQLSSELGPSMPILTNISSVSAPSAFNSNAYYEHKYDPYNLEFILGQMGNPNKIYHIKKDDPAGGGPSAEELQLDAESALTKSRSSATGHEKHQSLTGQSTLGNVLNKFWEKTITRPELELHVKPEDNYNSLLFMAPTHRNPFKSAQFTPIETTNESEISKKQEMPVQIVEQFSLEKTRSVDKLSDKLLLQIEQLQSSSVEKFKESIPEKRVELSAPKLTKSGYYSTPSIESMSMMTDDQLSRVCDLTIRNEKFGEIFWPGFTDVREMDFDKIVEFSDKSLSLYKNMDGSVPPPGQGLNKTAVITLYNCVPIGDYNEEKDRQIIKNMEDYTKSLKCEFISASTKTGNWKFRSVPEKNGAADTSSKVYSANMCKF